MKKILLFTSMFILTCITIFVVSACGGSDNDDDFADHKITCTSCGGTGVCMHCYGNGVCQSCNGQGNIPERKVYNSQTGMYTIYPAESCAACWGSGKCYYCTGNGQCTDCEGTGYVDGNHNDWGSGGSGNYSGGDSGGSSGGDSQKRCKYCFGKKDCRKWGSYNDKFYCHGSGNCFNCYGRGYFSAGGDPYTPCGNCNTPGYVSPYGKQYNRYGDGLCAECGGTGICHRCHGTGIEP